MSIPRCTAREMEVSPELIGMYYNYDEELKKSNAAILRLIKEEFARENYNKGFKVGFKRGLKLAKQRLAQEKKEAVINMYKDNALIEKICKYVNLPIKKVNKIIEDYNSKGK